MFALLVAEESLECPISMVKHEFSSSLIALSDDVFRLAIYFGLKFSIFNKCNLIHEKTTHHRLFVITVGKWVDSDLMRFCTVHRFQ